MKGKDIWPLLKVLGWDVGDPTSSVNSMSVSTCMSSSIVGSFVSGSVVVSGVMGFVARSGASSLKTVVPFRFPYSPMTRGLASGWGAIRKAWWKILTYLAPPGSMKKFMGFPAMKTWRRSGLEVKDLVMSSKTLKGLSSSWLSGPWGSLFFAT